jgi:hypothetical protein
MGWVWVGVGRGTGGVRVGYGWGTGGVRVGVGGLTRDWLFLSFLTSI